MGSAFVAEGCAALAEFLLVDLAAGVALGQRLFAGVAGTLER
jgi:hypothetical protein